jgi:hypothetical protein
MRFSPAYAKNRTTGARVPVWLPDTYSTTKAYRKDRAFVTVEVGRQRRVLVSRLVEMAVEFKRTQEERQRLGHDCAVFALACETNDAQSGVLFNQPGGKIVKIREVAYNADGTQDEPVTAVGEIAFTTDAYTEDERLGESPNFLVRANVDGGIPLYLSKLGTGPVVLSTFQSMAEFYPVRGVGTVEGLHVVDYE